MSTASDITDGMFLRAIVDDEGTMGYPTDCSLSFVPADLPDVDAVVWRNLHERDLTTVVVHDTFEVAFERAHLNPLNPLELVERAVERLRGRVSVTVRHRGHDHAPLTAVRTAVGRKPMTELHERAAL